MLDYTSSSMLKTLEDIHKLVLFLGVGTYDGVLRIVVLGRMSEYVVLLEENGMILLAVKLLFFCLLKREFV